MGPPQCSTWNREHRKIVDMTRQPVLGQFGALLRQSILTEVRARAWIWMALTMTLAALIIRLIPIPFWNDAISLRAVMGSNIAVIAITIAIVSSYELFTLAVALG